MAKTLEKQRKSVPRHWESNENTNGALRKMDPTGCFHVIHKEITMPASNKMRMVKDLSCVNTYYIEREG